jgi:hypothetical protein
MRAFSVTYNVGIDETKVTLSKEFERADIVLKLDVLQDAIAELHDIYEETRKEFMTMYAPKGAKQAEENLT